MAIDHSAERRHFETAAYATYFINSIRNDPKARPFALVLDDETVDKATFCTLDDDGTYKTNGLQPAWVFWCKRAELDVSGDFFAVLEDAHQALATQMDIPRDDRGEQPLRDLATSLSAFITSVRLQHAGGG